MANAVSDTSVLLIGFQDQDNLGLRYLSSSVRRAGFTSHIATFTKDPAPLISLAAQLTPRVVGLSLIFQYMAADYARVVEALREHGVHAHITIGGHYPSFDYGEVLTRMPGVDSIVRFDGEIALVELLEKLTAGEEWRNVRGLAYRRGSEVVANPLQPSVEDLDTLPVPDRSDIDYRGQDLAIASVLGSRGCPWNCNFCSIRPFYEAQGGTLRRLRDPQHFVDEIHALHVDKGARLFLFQDDDFLATGPRARDWATAIADRMIGAGLAGQIAFKISCRSNEVHEATLRRLAEAGLTHVYMGVESGDEQGLRNMNKQLKPAHHLKAGEILKALDLSFDFGFMILEPYSTLESVRNSIEFLDAFVGDGWAIAKFWRTLPYAGTPLKRQLEAEGRLLGTAFEPDYRFLDPRLDRFHEWVNRTFDERNFGETGLCHVLRALLLEAHMKIPGFRNYSADDRRLLHHLTAMANRTAVETLRKAITYLGAAASAAGDAPDGYLAELTVEEKEAEARIIEEVSDFYWDTRDRVGGMGAAKAGDQRILVADVR